MHKIIIMVCQHTHTDVSVSVGQTTYNVQESDGSVTLSYVLNREAVRDVSFDVINVDGTAIGGGVGM